MLINNKNYYVEKVAQETGRKYKDVLADMELDRIKFGLSFREYYNEQIYNVSLHEKKKKVLSVVNGKKKKKDRIVSIKEKSGLDAKAILRNIANLDKKNIFAVSLAVYEKYEMFDKSEEENIKLLENLKARDIVVKELVKKVDFARKGEISYSKLEEEMRPVYELTKKTLGEGYKKELIDRIRNIIPEAMRTEGKMTDIAIDMEVTRLVLRFGHTEYLMFRFFEKDLKERNTFLSSAERRTVLKKKNSSEAAVTLNNKALCYDIMKEYYGREAAFIGNKKSFKAFKTFVRMHPVFVIKPLELSFGKGIAKFEAAHSRGLKKQFLDLLDSYGEFMVEELIIQHEKMKVLNFDSVNTIRIPTYYDGERTVVQRPFLKIGRKGSFVDNGGSGGIIVAIDYYTGLLISNGIDETGMVYEKHPDSGIVFKGYQLPEWDKVKKLSSEVANKIKGAAYVGWDFACTEEGEWIVVEGNAMTQFFGQQAPQSKGMREEFLNEVK